VPFIEKLKEETWNLELTKQELTLSVTELQQHLHKATSEQTKLAKQTNDLRSDIEQLRDREEKLTALLETSKQRHEQDMTSLRRHCAGLQREAQQHAKHIDTLTSELAIAKAQSRLGKHQSATASGTINNSNSGSNNGANGGQLSSDDSDPSSSHDPHYRSGSSSSLPPSSPKQTPVGGSGGGRTAQAMEFETLKTSLAHAHRMVSNLRSHLHKEKTEKFEFKKLLAESQETIEQLQNDPQLWVDASVSGQGQGGASANGSLEDQKKRKVKQHRRATRKLHRGGLGGNSGGGGGFGGGSGTPPLSSSRSVSSKHRGGKSVLWSWWINVSNQLIFPFYINELVGGGGDDSNDEDDDDAYSYSSVSEDDDNLNDANDDAPAGFTSLSLELSQSTAKLNNTAVEMGVMTDDIVIVHDRNHYEQQLQKLHQLEQWQQASLEKSTRLSAQSQPCIDQAPLTSCEITTQTNPGPTMVDVALQTALPISVHQDSQCDLIQPRDEEAEALALAAAKSAAALEAAEKATQEAEAKSAAAIALAVAAATKKANDEAAAALSDAVESATIKTQNEAAVALAAAVESATIKAHDESAVSLAAAVESAVTQANKEAVLALSAAVEAATIKAKDESAVELAKAVELAVTQANQEAALALSDAVKSATIKSKDESAVALAEAVESAVTQANQEAALALSVAVETATSQAQQQAALDLSEAVESAVKKATLEAEAKSATAIAAAVALATAAARKEAIDETQARATTEAQANTAKAMTEAEANTQAALAAAVANATAKANEAAAKAAQEAEAKSAVALSNAVDSATTKANEEAAVALAIAVDSAITKANKEAALALDSAIAKANEEAAVAQAAAVDSAIIKANEEAAMALESAIAKANEAAAVALATAVDSAITKANEEAAVALAAAVDSATTRANEEAALTLAAAVDSAKHEATTEAEARSVLAISAAVDSAIAKANAESALTLSEAVDSAIKKATLEAEATLAAAMAEATTKANEAKAKALEESEANSAVMLAMAVAEATTKAKEQAALERSSIPTMDQGTQYSVKGVDMSAQVDRILTLDASVQHEYASVDQHSQYDYVPSTVSSATQYENTIISKDVSTQCEESEATRMVPSTTVIPSNIETASADPMINQTVDGADAELYDGRRHGGVITTLTSASVSQAQSGSKSIDMATAAPLVSSRNIAPASTPMDSNNDWLGSLNDDGPLDRSLKPPAPLPKTDSITRDHKLYSQEEMDSTVAKAVEEATARNNEQQQRSISDSFESMAPARPTQPPPSSLIDKATRNSSNIASATSAATDFSDDAGTISGLNRQASLSSSYMTDNNATSRPSNTLHYGASSSSAAGIAPPSITSSIHDEHSVMVRPLPTTADPSISSITQTMIGEWLTKYTRKPMGGQGFSERRHERYFWIHPYTRTLYWCTRAPGAEGGELKAKSAFVENVTVGKATDDDYSSDGNGVPCLMIQTSTRQIKIRAPTKERHDLWLEVRMRDAWGMMWRFVSNRCVVYAWIFFSY
jgi:hypothetical protein